ncbi:membrane protein [Staphylococcus aureus]|nr:membrane protein [Staphylococcus aureus]
MNKKEKHALDQRLSSITDKDNVNFNKPITFANAYLRENVFRSKETKSYSIFVTLVVMMFAYVALLGLFLFGLITSLSGVQFFVNPKVELSTTVVILTIIGAILLMLVSIYLIKITTSYFTKKLIEHKFNGH